MKIIKIELAPQGCKDAYRELFGMLLESFDMDWKSPIKPAWMPAWNVILMSGPALDEVISVLADEGITLEDLVACKEIDI